MIRIKLAAFILAVPFGVFIFIYGGYDDSPGAQLLGVVMFIVGIIGLIKNRKQFFSRSEEATH